MAVLHFLLLTEVSPSADAERCVSLGGRQLPQQQGNQGEAFCQICTERCGSDLLTLL